MMDDRTLTMTGVIEAVSAAPSDGPRAPRWARWCIGIGVAMLVTSVGAWGAVESAAVWHAIM